MILTEPECKLFYDLTWSLQYYVHQKLNIIIIPEIKSLDDYIKDNPQKFSAEELAEVRSWKHFVKDKFYIERYLKKYRIIRVR